MGIEYLLFSTGLIPAETKKVNSVHMFIVILAQASVFLIIAVALQTKFKFPYFGFGDEITAKDFFFGFAGLMGINFLGSIFMTLTGTYPDQFKEFNPELLRSNLYLFMFTIALLGPIYEEIIFRGYILGMLVAGETSKIKIILGVVFTSLMFMLAHFDDLSDNLYIGLPLFLLGAYFSFWAIRKKGIMLTIFLHITQNFLAAMAMLYQARH